MGASFAALFLALLGCGTDVDEGTAFVTTSDSGTGGGTTTADVPIDMEEGDESGEGSAEGGSTDSTGGDADDSTGEGTGDGDSECGNGQVDETEQCDGANLNGFSCEQLGYGGGMLGCDPMTCTYDTSNCTPDDGGTSG